MVTISLQRTLEEKIELLIKSKKEIADSVVSAGENWLTEMSDSELSSFSLSRDAVEDINRCTEEGHPGHT